MSEFWQKKDKDLYFWINDNGETAHYTEGEYLCTSGLSNPKFPKECADPHDCRTKGCIQMKPHGNQRGTQLKGDSNTPFTWFI